MPFFMPFLQFFTDNVQTQSEQDRQRILSGRPSYVVATRELDTDQDFFVRVGHETTYRKVASSRPVYYSILNSFGQRSQYISIKFPLHKQSENP